MVVLGTWGGTREGEMATLERRCINCGRDGKQPAVGGLKDPARRKLRGGYNNPF